ncbi:MAG: ABC transporter permease subunit [Candidatus Parcubacteria bacterium]|nr:ABC transporter permease subunit [Burkholderiales bacterium]
MKKGWIYQAALLAAAGLVVWFFAYNTAQNLETRKIASGFAFLWREAGFEIGETGAIAFSAADTYLRALGIGLWNTFRVAAIGVVLATLLGTLVGLARLSPNWLLAKLASGYVEVIRNVPLLVQLFFWYAVITEYMPDPGDALQPLANVFLSNRGIVFPTPWSTPVLEGFNFMGGAALSPEFAALLVGLVSYTAAFIGEIVRAGVLSVGRGQVDAAFSMGLTRRRALRFVVLPQALRLIVPPLTSQYLNLAKNSSLAVAIGYPDLVSIANTTMNQTGQAIEGVAIIMAVFLTISLSISAFMNWYNRRVALKGLGR